MRRIKEALRLHLQAGLSYDEVGRALKISKSSAGKYVSLARAAGVDCELAQTLSDDELEARLFRPPVPRSSHQLAPDFALVHQELKRAGVTLQLLWEEYARDNALAYKYTSFCIKYRAFAQGLKRSMRQVHIAGEKLFVDYSGDTVPLIDTGTGEITAAQIFVATLGASSYTYACATARQTTADWIGAQVRALEFFGGTPRLIVPDQTRSLIKYPDSYDPEPNRTYEEFAEHYGCALLAARPGRPRDKAWTSYCTLCGRLSGDEPSGLTGVAAADAADELTTIGRLVQAVPFVAVGVARQYAFAAELMDGGR
jgi:transposase